jgi:hypothetical protein
VTWLAWRQFRTQALAGAALTAAASAWLVVLGMRIHGYYDDKVRGCSEQTCEVARQEFGDLFTTPVAISGAAALAVPALIGIFWGAPLVARELEHGTHRLVWTQGVSRARWLAVKLVVVALAAAAVGAFLATLLSWAAGPYDSVVGSRFGEMTFGARGVVLIGYAVFAFVLGTTAGMLLRRTLPAMAVTLGVLVATQMAMPLLVRAHLLDPVERSVALQDATAARQIDSLGTSDDDPSSPVEVSGYTIPGAWMLTERSALHRADGETVTAADLQACMTGSMVDSLECLSEGGVTFEVAYHPADRYWPFQGIETGIMLGLGAVLTALAFRRLPRAAG